MAIKKNELKAKASGSVAGSGKKNLMQMIQAMQPQIEKALPSVITPERFTRMMLTAVSSTPKLAACTQESFLGAMMQAAQLGLEPNTPLGQAYLIPYGNQVQFQIGYKGLIDLAHRSGEFKNIDARVVYENDEFEFEYGLEPKLKHKPAMTNRGNAICYYAVYTLVNGGFGFTVMSVEDVTKFAKEKSKSFNNGPWKTDFDEMAKKTVIKKALKYAPIKTEFARQIETDERIKTDIKPDMVFDEGEPVEAEAVIVDEDGVISEEMQAEFGDFPSEEELAGK